MSWSCLGIDGARAGAGAMDALSCYSSIGAVSSCSCGVLAGSAGELFTVVVWVEASVVGGCPASSVGSSCVLAVKVDSWCDSSACVFVEFCDSCQEVGGSITSQATSIKADCSGQARHILDVGTLHIDHRRNEVEH